MSDHRYAEYPDDPGHCVDCEEPPATADHGPGGVEIAIERAELPDALVEKAIEALLDSEHRLWIWRWERTAGESDGE